MTSTDIPLPPAHTVQAALHKVTETLASELARPTESTPSWSEFEWRIARAAAAMHGVAPLLSSRLRWRGPADWGQFLALQRAHTLGRQRRIEQLLGAIDTRAQDEGLPVVALKARPPATSGLT